MGRLVVWLALALAHASPVTVLGAAAAMPASCTADPRSPVSIAASNFWLANRACWASFQQCSSSNRSSCAATCNSNLGAFGHDCRAAHGAFCRFRAFSDAQGRPGAPSFALRSALCLPSTCTRGDAPAVEAALGAEYCGGSKGTPSSCAAVVTCDFGLSSGAIIGIVSGVVAGFCGLIGAAVCCSRCDRDDDDDEASRGTGSFDASSLTAALGVERRPADGRQRVPSFAVVGVPDPGASPGGTRGIRRARWGDDLGDDSDSVGSVVAGDFLLEAEGRPLHGGAGDDGL